MKARVYYVEQEAEPARAVRACLGPTIGRGCATYPVEVTDEHAAARRDLPVVLVNGQPRGPRHLPPGAVHLIAAGYRGRCLPALLDAGYAVKVVLRRYFFAGWDPAPTLDGAHPVPGARWVRFPAPKGQRPPVRVAQKSPTSHP